MLYALSKASKLALLIIGFSYRQRGCTRRPPSDWQEKLLLLESQQDRAHAPQPIAELTATKWCFEHHGSDLDSAPSGGLWCLGWISCRDASLGKPANLQSEGHSKGHQLEITYR